MPTKVKIKIADDTELRKVLDSAYTISSQIKLCKYALLLAAHILEITGCQDLDKGVIREGFIINAKWQTGDACIHDVRQVGFKIHEAAKACDDIVVQTALRVVGQAVATAHMREHAMVASDYAVKAVNLITPDNMGAVKQERIWQIEHLNGIENPA